MSEKAMRPEPLWRTTGIEIVFRTESRGFVRLATMHRSKEGRLGRIGSFYRCVGGRGQVLNHVLEKGVDEVDVLIDQISEILI